MITRPIILQQGSPNRGGRHLANSDAFRFLSQFWKKPAQVAAILPSSDRLATSIVDNANLGEARVVVELGAGTGAITHHILRAMPKYGKLIVFENNDKFTEELSKRYPSTTVINDSAAQLSGQLRELGIGSCDSIIATLPWYWQEEKERNQTLDQIWDCLRYGGTFTTCMHLQSMFTLTNLRFQREIRHTFNDYRVSKIVWGNVMPARGVTARK